jgi:hypothetical protein
LRTKTEPIDYPLPIGTRFTSNPNKQQLHRCPSKLRLLTSTKAGASLTPSPTRCDTLSVALNEARNGRSPFAVVQPKQAPANRVMRRLDL